MPSGKKCWTNAGRKWLEKQADMGDDAVKFWESLEPTQWWRGQLAEELWQLDEVECAIGSVEEQLDAYAANKEEVKRVRSAPGVGPRLSEAVVAIIGDPHRFKNGWQVAAYAGLVPRVFQSGNMGCVTLPASLALCGEYGLKGCYTVAVGKSRTNRRAALRAAVIRQSAIGVGRRPR